jgi:ammonia channel protein AmtB
MRNEGTLDRVIRLIVGVALLYVGFLHKQWITGTLATVLGVVGVILCITSITGFCLLYKPFGIDTRKTARNPQ